MEQGWERFAGSRRRTMMQCSVLGGFVALVATAACNPPPVNPNDTFTIEADLLDANGLPAADVPVRIYKVDQLWRAQDDFLQYPDISSGLDPNAVYNTTSDSTGHVQKDLLGSAVNTASGTGSAYLTLVYQDPGDPTGYLATASDWHYFQNSDPIWDAGTLALWDGGTASQVGDTVDYSWQGDQAPAGEQPASGIPTYLFTYDNASPDLQWAAFTASAAVDVPRAAYDDGADPAEYFLTSFSQPVGSSQLYQHRTSLKQVDASWQSELFPPVDLVLNISDALYESDAGSFDPNATTNTASPCDPEANDGNVVNTATFGLGTTDIFIDLGGVTSFTEVLVYNLVLDNFQNAEIRLATSNDGTTFSPLGNRLDGSWDFQNWTYIADTTGGSARYIRIEVAPLAASGPRPSLQSVSEINVLQ